jgi:hypothetical protein
VRSDPRCNARLGWGDVVDAGCDHGGVSPLFEGAVCHEEQDPEVRRLTVSGHDARLDRESV